MTARDGLRRRLTVVVTAFGLGILLLVGVGTSSMTEASWTDSEYGTGAFTARVIPPPIIDSCTLNPGLLGANPVVTMKWRFPAGTTYTAANVAYAYARADGVQSPAVPGPNLSTTGPVAGEYTTTWNAGLLAGLLGSYNILYLQTRDPSTWTSKQSSAVAGAALLGIGPYCTPNPPP